MDVVHTARLRLERIDDRHRSLFHQMDANVDVVGPDGLHSADESDAFIDEQLQHWQRYGFGLWVIFDHASSACVGRGGLRHIDLENRRVVQVGYGLFPQYWGFGFATEVAQASVGAAFDVLRLERIVAVARPTNVASRRVLEKTGFRQVREVFYDDAPHVLYERHRPR